VFAVKLASHTYSSHRIYLINVEFRPAGRPFILFLFLWKSKKLASILESNKHTFAQQADRQIDRIRQTDRQTAERQTEKKLILILNCKHLTQKCQLSSTPTKIFLYCHILMYFNSYKV